MAKKSWVVKQSKQQKFKVREYNRCLMCGRSRGYIRDFGLCRLCFRKMADNGLIPGVTRASW
jgi:small subunit ribosomal protein S14